MKLKTESLHNLNVSGTAKNYGWASGGCSILSEFGSIQLEFDYLSNVTKNPIFSQKVGFEPKNFPTVKFKNNSVAPKVHDGHMAQN